MLIYMSSIIDKRWLIKIEKAIVHQEIELKCYLAYWFNKAFLEYKRIMSLLRNLIIMVYVNLVRYNLIIRANSMLNHNFLIVVWIIWVPINDILRGPLP